MTNYVLSYSFLCIKVGTVVVRAHRRSDEKIKFKVFAKQSGVHHLTERGGA